jgi:hypothetical protein
MLALEPTVIDAIWQSFAAYLTKRCETTHPLGCHRPRISDRYCFEAILFRLVTGCSWDVAADWAEEARPPCAAATSGWPPVRSNTWSK